MHNQLNPSATLFVVSAPSGAGKTSLVNAVLKQLDQIKLSISYTTRLKRPQEEEGVHYHFVTPTRFQQMVVAQEFLEHAQVFNHFYGTAKHWVMEQLQQGTDIILEIDWQGAKSVRQLLPDAVLIFILPPSLATLKQRLHSRGQDSEQTIQARLIEAAEEISHCQDFDYWLVNQQFDQALADLTTIIQASRLRHLVQQQKLTPLLVDLNQSIL